MIARPVKPSLNLLPSPYQAVRAWYRDIREDGVFAEQHCTPSVVGHVEAVREKLVVDILNRFLLSDNVPFPCNFLLDSTLFSTPRSWIPVVDAQPLLDG